MADSNLTIEDLNTFMDALRYSQTLVNTANAGADLSIDFLNGLEYYGSVSMSIPTNIMISADDVYITGATEDIMVYDKNVLSNYFYGQDEIIPIPSYLVDSTESNSLLTTGMIEQLNPNSGGIFSVESLEYDPSVAFDYDSEISGTVLPVYVLDQKCKRIGSNIDASDGSWDVTVYNGTTEVKSAPNTSTIVVERGNFEGMRTKKITSVNPQPALEDIVSGVITEDGVIDDNAAIPADKEEILNFATFRKLNSTDAKKIGDTITLKQVSTYTDAELKAMVDDHLTLTSSDLNYSGVDTFLNAEQARMIAEYIYRQMTGIETSTIVA